MNSSVDNMKTTLDIVCGKWKAAILLELVEQPLRFSEIKRVIPRIPHQTLIKHLKELEEDGLLNKEVSEDIPPKVKYSLTEYGYSLESLLHRMEEWGKNHELRRKQMLSEQNERVL
ncbi:winged helix-turn-helix transcriptional regulator [Guptibacillus hwajinpoensis]|uniref:DNA-binding HxlR family transcriptional regulator n=1 Tax=Guptibacillus hwajinpoensis TaxID=208199 RepID=A0ABU0K300_9BACL|nr:helix-turn-helix domain-containing protein [Alkalihalobacillus hemicentroti]MDQ0483736.1 DNA-binding HxlR family transcriptional regulator [Alkalihalobacillus hemicentroti]